MPGGVVGRGARAPRPTRYAPRTVAYWVRRFEAEGFSGLVDGDRPGCPKRLNGSQLEDIAIVLRKDTSNVGLEGSWDGKALSTCIQQQWGVSLGVRQCQRLFRQLGFRLCKPRPKIAQADSERQEQYKKFHHLQKDSSVDLWALGEVRFEQHGTRCRMWVPAETKDPFALHHPTRKSVGYFGAVRLWDG